MGTVLEELENANNNIQKNTHIGLMIGKIQLNDAVILLKKGYDLNDDAEKLIGDGNVNDVPNKRKL